MSDISFLLVALMMDVLLLSSATLLQENQDHQHHFNVLHYNIQYELSKFDKFGFYMG